MQRRKQTNKRKNGRKKNPFNKALAVLRKKLADINISVTDKKMRSTLNSTKYMKNGSIKYNAKKALGILTSNMTSSKSIYNPIIAPVTKSKIRNIELPIFYNTASSQKRKKEIITEIDEFLKN